ncbi:VOC family protein [Tissierella creatinini]|nr:VOC family protein [Tissierella creatinini]TJX64616.1 VOC family protein [Soehngenia saccharolytica]
MSNYHQRPNIFVQGIVLRVQDLKKSAEFYKSILGFSILKEELSKVVFTVDGRRPIVTIISPNDIIPKIPRKTGLYHIAVLLPNRHQLGLFFKNIRDKDYPIIGGAHHGVSEAIYLEDPDENGIEVYVDTPDSTWGRHDYAVNMVTEKLDYSELLKDAGEDTWNGTPEDTIIGHIHLHVADLDESFKFYNLLGFKLTQASRHSAYFISTGGYHHHIGMNIWNGRGSGPLPENSAGMEYFSLRFPSEDLRAEKILTLREAGHVIIETDRGMFVEDPSENLIKLVV